MQDVMANVEQLATLVKGAKWFIEVAIKKKGQLWKFECFEIYFEGTK